MSIGISLIVLVIAVLRASWNALLRGGGDRVWSMTIMCIAIAVACPGVAAGVRQYAHRNRVPLPAPAGPIRRIGPRPRSNPKGR